MSPLPAALAPMLACPAPLPPDAATHQLEFKWDGVRALVWVDAAGTVTIRSRTGRDVTVAYPELRLPRGPLLLDGEIVALDAAGRPSFELLQSRMHVSRASQASGLAREQPATLMLFDLLWTDRSLLRCPYVERRESLEALAGLPANVQVPPRFPAEHPGDGADVLAAARSLGLEGVVAKRVRSTYLPGQRSPDWIKVKIVQSTDVVIVGWDEGQNARAGTIGALLLAVHDDEGHLAYAGKVGSGFRQSTLADLLARVRPLATDAPTVTDAPADQVRTARWLRPELVARVEFTAWTRDGRLRHPVWRGLRPDLPAADVRREA